MMIDVFVAVGIVGAVVLVLSLVLDDVFDAVIPDAGWISGPIIGAFAAAFGLVGWVTQRTFDAPVVLAALAGVAGGVGLGAFTARVARALMRSPTDATPNTAALVGREGRVVTPVRAGGIGEVVMPLGGQPVKLSATATADLPVGTRVTVVSVQSSTRVAVEATESFWS
jgi:membrane protein implicated in regulation of membrane protease activity